MPTYSGGVVFSAIIIFLVGIALLAYDLLGATSFFGYLALLSLIFLALFLKDKISVLKIGGNEIQFIRDAKEDIRGYLSDFYKSQLLTVAANKPIDVNVPHSKAVNFDTLIETHDKLRKHEILPEVKSELQKAAETVMYNQLVLLSVYAMHWSSPTEVVLRYV